MKITDEIHQVGGVGLSASEDAAVYLISFDGHAALVDAGCGYATGRIVKNIHACGVTPEQVRYLFLTHCHFDHTGGAGELADRLGCKIVAHTLDAVYLENGDNGVTAALWYGAEIHPFHVDIKIKGEGEVISLGEKTIQAIHVPGHSPGSVVYLTESHGKKVLFGQDVHGPLHPDLLSDKDQYLASLGQMLNLEADILCEGHFGVYNGRQVVREFIESYLR